MTFNKDDILARLQKGDSVDDIAQEMAEALNDAKTSYDAAEAKRIEEEAKLAEAKAKLEAEKASKRVIIQKLVDDFTELANVVGKHDIADKLDALTVKELDDIAEAVEALFELAEMTEKFSMLEFGSKPIVKKAGTTADDIIRDFLKTL